MNFLALHLLNEYTVRIFSFTCLHIFHWKLHHFHFTSLQFQCGNGISHATLHTKTEYTVTPLGVFANFFANMHVCIPGTLFSNRFDEQKMVTRRKFLRENLLFLVYNEHRETRVRIAHTLKRSWWDFLMAARVEL